MANDDLPPALWQGDESTGAQIAHWERRRWAQFHAAIVSATSSSDAGVLGNFPQEAQQELKEQELKQKVEQLIGLLAAKDALLAEKDEWTEALEEELQLKEQEIINLNKEITWRDLEIGPQAPLRPPSLN